MDQKIQEVIELLEELLDDEATPKNAKQKIELAMEALNGDGEKNLNVYKAINELDELAENINIEPFTRSQILSVVSILESLSN